MMSFDLPSTAGTRVELRPFLKQKPVIVYFFATWYAGAADELAALRALSDAHPDALTILAVAIDKPEARAKVDAFITENGVKFPVLLDPDGNLVQSRYTGGVPDATTTLLIDRAGNLIDTRGAEEDEEVPLREMVEAMLVAE